MLKGRPFFWQSPKKSTPTRIQRVVPDDESFLEAELETCGPNVLVREKIENIEYNCSAAERPSS